MSVLVPDLYSVDVVGNGNVIMNSQGEKMSPLRLLVKGLNLIAKSATEVQQPFVTTSGIQTVHSVDGFDFSVNESIAKFPSVNTVFKKCDQPCPIYDVNNMAIEEEFINTIIFANQGDKGLPICLDSPVYKKWQQVDFPFGFVL